MASDLRTKYVFISNLPYDQTEELMSEIFKTVGPVKEFRILFDPQGKHRGLGYVEYADSETAASAIRNLQGVEIEGRALRLEYGVVENGVVKAQSRSAIGRARDPTNRTKIPMRDYRSGVPGVNGITDDRSNRLQQPSQTPINSEAQVQKSIDSLTPLQTVELMIQLKKMMDNSVEDVYNILSTNSKLSFSLLRAMILMCVADSDSLNELIHSEDQNDQPGATTDENLSPELSSILSQANSAEIIQSIMLMTDESIRALPQANQTLVYKIRSQVQQLLNQAGLVS